MRGLFLLLVWGVGCGSIDPEAPLDAQGREIPVPEPGERWLSVSGIAPEGEVIPSRPVIRLELSEYVDDDLMLDVDVISLVSGGRRASGRAVWDMQTKTLSWTPFSPLIDGLDYSLAVNASRLESVAGSPLFPPRSRAWRVDAGLDSSAVPSGMAPRREARWDEVAEVFSRKCWTCHQDPQWRLNPLTPESMVGVKAADLDRFLVVPLDPDDSYLVQKVLPDYPTIVWDVQPPAWSGVEPLEASEIATIIDWVASGARR